MKIAEEIQEKARNLGINPFNTPFTPKDLGITASNYGSFSDFCDNTKSSRWNSHVCLKAVEFNKGHRPTKYLLLPPSQWIVR